MAFERVGLKNIIKYLVVLVIFVLKEALDDFVLLHLYFIRPLEKREFHLD